MTTSNPKEWHRKRKEHLVQYKGGKCFDCGGVFPACCYDFDHREPEEKLFTISYAASNGRVSMEELEKEADKCDLVCSNCHRIRTSNSPKVSRKISAGKRKEPWNKGKTGVYDEDTLKKMGESLKATFSKKVSPNLGRALTTEHRRKISDALKRKKEQVV